MLDDMTSLMALEAAATKPKAGGSALSIPAPLMLTPLATVPQVSDKTKKLIIYGSLGVLAVALVLYWRSRS